jgi:hypothetical protein
MKYFISLLIVQIGLFSGLFQLSAQELEARSDLGKDLPSTAINTNQSKFDHTKTINYPKEKIYIIVKKPDLVLYGNPCMEEITHGMGFQYLLIPETEAYSSADGYNNEGMFWHNFKAHLNLIKKNGLFYRKKLKRAIKFCRQMSGDFEG